MSKNCKYMVNAMKKEVDYYSLPCRWWMWSRIMSIVDDGPLKQHSQHTNAYAENTAWQKA